VNDVSKPERATQDRVLALFKNDLHYRYLGDWTERAGNSPIEEELLRAFWQRRGHTPEQISRALNLLRSEAGNPNRTLYANNQAVYSLLRYGAQVKNGPGEQTETLPLVDWNNPEANDFAVAEEVTLRGGHERRPDVVLYLNGLAVGVLELKNSRVSIGHGIRQNLSNQLPEFNEGFFATVQLVMAGNDTEGLQYGTIGTPEKLFLKWKEDETDNSGYKLDKYLRKLCSKERLLELMHDFVLFDGGIKKLPRVHQYFGLKAAQAHVQRRQGGIIWHTQGAGKSILMVLLARWILEALPKARVLVVTDRDELDEQIERVFQEAGETVHRTNSGRDLMHQLSLPDARLMCSLVHKFGGRSRGKSEAEFEQFIKELEAAPSQVYGEVFVFVDECHRTQSGRLHRVMKALMPSAVFIGFTGTPLLKEDKATSMEVFGGYIHTYKFAEAVEDKVVLDLVYEARDIDQKLGSTEQIDQWFAAKTRGLNDWQRDELKKQWGTLQKVLSSRSRMDRVVSDIVFDFATKQRLSSERGNAMLVASSIYEACRYFELFQKTPFKGRCAIVTSYNPLASHITMEETGANTESDKQFIYNTYTELLQDVVPDPGESKTETYEKHAKQRFIKSPARMKLLVVVDKLLTGFDAPPCSYLYIDKSMQDHGLFQAICRTNRLDGDDKEFGYIVDYKDLFKRVEKAIAVYTSELDAGADDSDPQVMLKDRLDMAREKLDAAFEALHLLCQPVQPPQSELQYIQYFCGNTEIPTDLQEREPQRVALYRAVVTLLRAWGNAADELETAGYSAPDVERMKARLKHYLDLREVVRRASGETLDLKAYEADMRHLIDTYIEASAPRKISPFDGVGLLDLIVKTGIADAIAHKLAAVKDNHEAVAESIENNVRSKIIKEQLADPAFFERMSALLDEIIRLRKHRAVEYEGYLQRIAELTEKVMSGRDIDTPPQLHTPGRMALYNNIKDWVTTNAVGQPHAPYANKDAALELVMTLDASIKEHRPDGWRGMFQKEQIVKQSIYNVVKDVDAVNRIYPIVFAHREY
jgi:type I restriction enzyme R subunit